MITVKGIQMKLIMILITVLLLFTVRAFADEIEVSDKQSDLWFILSMSVIVFTAIVIVVCQILVARQEEEQCRRNEKIKAQQKQIKSQQEQIEALQRQMETRP